VRIDLVNFQIVELQKVMSPIRFLIRNKLGRIMVATEAGIVLINGDHITHVLSRMKDVSQT
jgi:hypothetical protein